ncbi:hypothetical protein BXOR1_03770 [Xanthomonas oryzae pv. oryzicola]|nr:hypothetical protein FE36_08425 [Xanthomonas oryzae pv. oryzicola]OLK90971.1 hypothetical protein BXOR1_03770 [Xanthomonas oryzae pv. oryzicola]QEO97780.1 hypothetical protein XOCgx_2791 [Xanthomonas oryzae pv. oryzicola]
MRAGPALFAVSKVMIASHGGWMHTDVRAQRSVGSDPLFVDSIADRTASAQRLRNLAHAYQSGAQGVPHAIVAARHAAP